MASPHGFGLLLSEDCCRDVVDADGSSDVAVAAVPGECGGRDRVGGVSS